MFENIVVPLDGSRLAEVVLPYAQELMGRLHSRLTLLHVCDTSDVNVRREYFSSLAEKVRQDAERCHGLFNPRIETVVLAGKVAEGIVDYIGGNAIDLTIMATHGRSGISRWALGSTADKVLRGASRPIALIRASDTRAEVCLAGLFNRILLPLDGSKTGEAALPHVKRLAGKLNSQVILFQVLPETQCPAEVNWIELREEARKRAEALLHPVGQSLKNEGISVKYDVRFGDAAGQIIDVASTKAVDVVAMSTHGRSGINRWMFGSVAEKILRGASTPVLLVRSAQDTGPL